MSNQNAKEIVNAVRAADKKRTDPSKAVADVLKKQEAAAKPVKNTEGPTLVNN